MGEKEVIEVLEKYLNLPLSVREIAEELESTPEKISAIIRRLMKWYDLEIIELHKDLAREFYNCKRGMRLYSVNINGKV